MLHGLMWLDPARNGGYGGEAVGDLHCHSELLLKALDTCGRNCDSPCVGQALHPTQVEAPRSKCRADCAREMRLLLAPIQV